VLVGALPGAGADMAAWIAYANSKRFSKEPEKFGTGHPEGLVESGSANNAALAGGWVPATLFGIPGDTITAIAIGVLYMKGLNPGPTLFTEKASSMYALYMVFIIANILMIPLGIIMIRTSRHVLRAPRAAAMPMILLLCAVGAFAIGNNPFAIVLVATFGPGLENLMIAVGIASIPIYARIVRGSVLSVKNREFVEAAGALGRRKLSTLYRHVVPNSLAPIIVQSSLQMAVAILFAAGLGFLGLGAQPPQPEWGLMLSRGREYLAVAPHVATFPGLAIMLVVFGFNLVGDALRDALDPRG
jgi:TctA family transporter